MLTKFLWQPFKKILRRFQRRRNRDLFVLAFLIFDLLVGSVLVYYFENSVIPAPENPIGLWDCIWLALTTTTTVGYGDFSANTVGGRMASIVFFYLGGIGVVAYLLGRMVEVGLDMRLNMRKGLLKLNLEEHILICNFPSSRMVEQIIHELRADRRSKDSSIVIVSDAIEELSFSDKDVYFVRGNPMEEERLLKANVTKAWMSIIIAQNIEEPHTDALVSAVVVLIKGLNPDCLCIAECADRNRQNLLRQCGADRIVFAGNLNSNLIVQEAIDLGVSGLIESFSSNRDGAQFYSERNDVGEITVERCETVLKDFDQCAHLLAVYKAQQQETEYLTLPAPEEKIGNGDHVIYIARDRLDWNKVQERLRKGDS